MAVGVLLLAAIAVLLLVVVALSCKEYNTWKRQGVPYLSPLPLFGNCMRTILQREPLFVTMHRIYERFPGKPFIGMYAGPSPVLLVSSTEAIKDILIKDFENFSNHKLAPSADIDPTFSKFLFCLPDAEWKSTRVKMTPSFSSGRLKSMFLSVRAVGKQLVQTIRDSRDHSGTVCVSSVCSRYGADVIGTCAFGCEAGALRDPNTSAFYRAVNEVFRFGPVQGLSTFTLMFADLAYRTLRLPLMHEWRSGLVRDLLRQAAVHREREPPRHRDIFDGLLQLRRDGEVSNEVFEGQVMAMQVAGSETSATTLLFALWELACQPALQDRLREELVAAAKADDGVLSYETVHDLRYLDQVYKETLRLWPVLPWLDRVCAADYTIPGTGIRLKKGTVVMVPVYSMHRDPVNYADPETFDPDRFADREMNKLAFLPFGGGPRACIGSRFADVSIKSALSQVLLAFRVSLAEGTPKNHQELVFSRPTFLVNLEKDLYLNFEPLS